MRIHSKLRAILVGTGLVATSVMVAAPAQAAAPSQIVLAHTTVEQSNGWACGPYATHIALTTFGWGSSISNLEKLEQTT